MKRDRYNALIKRLEIKVDSSDFVDENLMKEIDELHKYKPVSTRLHYIKCKALCKNGQTEHLGDKYKEMVSVEAVFDGNIELFQQVIEAYKAEGRLYTAERYQYMLNTCIGRKTDNDARLKELKQMFSQGQESVDILDEMEYQYYISCNNVLAYCMYVYKLAKYGNRYEDKKREKLYLKAHNMAYFAEYLSDKLPIALIANHNTNEDYDIFSYILHQLGVQVYLLSDIIYMDEEFDMQASAMVSMDNSQHFEDCLAIPVIARHVDKNKTKTNVAYILDYICKTETDNDMMMLIAPNDTIEEMRTEPCIAKRFDRLSEREATAIEHKSGFAWIGDYYSYISRIHKCNVKQLVDREPQCEFSIVIPVRNATYTLEHTLRTCLEQEYEGDYEIVLSDNSTEGNTGVYDTYIKMSDKRIKYYKTPRDLGLVKSFEYAILQTRGRYILSIGADDGVFPWALSTLKTIWDAYSDRRFIKWIRGLYIWPGFGDGIDNMLRICPKMTRGKVEIKNYASKTYLEEIIKEPALQYMAPGLYINTAFKRDYIRVLYEETGTLWNGYNQDIYMGITNLAINEDIMSTEYPLTLAGQSSSSIGALVTKKNIKEGNLTNIDEIQMYGGRSICMPVVSKDWFMYPICANDISAVYKIITNLMYRGILSTSFIENVGDMYIYKKCIESLNLASDKADKILNESYELASRKSSKLADWYKANILSRVDELIEVNQQLIEDKQYKEGYSESGGVTLDASRFGVTNIYEAVQLYKDFVGF